MPILLFHICFGMTFLSLFHLEMLNWHTAGPWSLAKLYVSLYKPNHPPLSLVFYVLNLFKSFQLHIVSSAFDFVHWQKSFSLKIFVEALCPLYVMGQLQCDRVPSKMQNNVMLCATRIVQFITIQFTEVLCTAWKSYITYIGYLS